LEGFATANPSGDLTYKKDHGGRILEGDVNAHACMRCAWTSCHHTDARASGEFSVGFRHVGCCAFMLSHYHLDLISIVERIENV
jgi:hypothetical protein